MNLLFPLSEINVNKRHEYKKNIFKIATIVLNSSIYLNYKLFLHSIKNAWYIIQYKKCIFSSQLISCKLV